MTEPHPFTLAGEKAYALLEFERKMPEKAAPMEWRVVRTPLIHQEWELMLKFHPDRQLSVVRGCHT